MISFIILFISLQLHVTPFILISSIAEKEEKEDGLVIVKGLFGAKKVYLIN